MVRELKKYGLDTVGGQDVRWDDVVTERVEDFTPSYEKGNENIYLGTGFLVHQKILPAVMRVHSVSGNILDARFSGKLTLIRLLSCGFSWQGKTVGTKLEN